MDRNFARPSVLQLRIKIITYKTFRLNFYSKNYLQILDN